MKQFIEDNWFKITIVAAIFVHLFILFLNFYLEGKKHNLNIYKDSTKFCYDLTEGNKSLYLICNKAVLQYSLNKNFFINKKLQKDYEREKAFWSCYSNEWNKDKSYGKEKEDRISKYCSQEADKILK